MRNKHGIIIKDIFNIWKEDIVPLTENGTTLARERLYTEVQKILRQYIDEIENAKLKLYQEGEKKNLGQNK